MSTYYSYYDASQTPMARLLLAGDGERLSLLGFATGEMARHPEAGWVEDSAPFREVTRQLDAYFGGELREFDLPLALEGTTFQLKAWGALLHIPYGETRSYGDIARHIGKPKAFRAVGDANRKNRIPLIIPCHRVVDSDGSLGGYAHGLDTKQFLLDLESNHKESGSSDPATPLKGAA